MVLIIETSFKLISPRKMAIGDGNDRRLVLTKSVVLDVAGARVESRLR